MDGHFKMPQTIDLEREFFRIAKDLDSCNDVRGNFLNRIKQISEQWIDNKFRLGVLGLNRQNKNGAGEI